MDIQHYKDIFENYGGMMRTKELEQEKNSNATLEKPKKSKDLER